MTQRHHLIGLGLSLMTLPTLASSAATGTISAKDFNVVPGQWAVTAHPNIVNTSLPKQIMQSLTPSVQHNTQCIRTKEMPIGINKNCDYHYTRINRGKMTFTMTCHATNGPTVKGDGTLQFHGKTANGAMLTHFTSPLGNLTMKVAIDAHYTGPCTQ